MSIATRVGTSSRATSSGTTAKSWTVLAVVTNDGGPQTATVEPNADGLKDKLQSEKGAIELGPLHELLA